MNAIVRSTGVLAVLMLANMFGSPNAEAWPSCLTIFSNTYPASQTANLGGCQTCHQTSGGGPFNAYGADLRANGAAGAGGSCTGIDFAAALVAVEGINSDNTSAADINTNIVEITASTQPGWCDTTQSSTCANSAGTPPNVKLDPDPAPPPNAPPIANAGGPYAGEAGNTLIQFDGSGSNDPDGDALTYAWDFGDGSTGSGMMPTHTYGSAGDFQVSLVVNDGQLDSDPSVTSAAISAPPVNIAPTADPGGPYSGEPGQPVAMDGSASSDPNNDTLSYAWDFGDGAMGSGATPTHTYAAASTYTVSLTVNDGQADSVPATTTATIAAPPANRAPTASAGGPYSGDTGVAVSFDGSASSDPDNNPLTYMWNFGDTTTGSGATPTHTYAAAGTYTVSLVVNDGEFDSAAATSTATITDPTDRDKGAALYETNCLGCHSDPWDGPPVDAALPGKRRVAGARDCSIQGSIFGTSVFPNGVPEMQFLQGLDDTEITSIAEHLNSRETSGERRYVTACAGCHGNSGAGGRVDEDVHGDSADETLEAIADESEMSYLACLPRSDIDSITEFLMTLDDDNDDDGIDDDEDSDDDSDGIDDDSDSDDDNDGVSDDDERDQGTDPRDSDSDNDGLEDGDERDRGTDPMDADTDDDGVSDGDEVLVFGTNPLEAESSTATESNSGSGSGSAGLLLLMMLAVTAGIGRARRRDSRS